MSSWECQVCKKPVSHGGVGFNFKIWHNKCFRCLECGLSLNSHNYRARDGKPYCLAHYRSDPSADDRGSFVMLPLAGMKKVLSDCETAIQNITTEIVFSVLPGMMAPPVRRAEGLLMLPRMCPPTEQRQQSNPDSEPETVRRNSQQGTVAAPIKEPKNRNRVIVSISAAGDKTMELAIGSICEEEVDVIVNSIGTSLDMSTGQLATAIRQAAGAEIEEELTKLGSEPPAKSGSIIATKGYKLPCKHVLHVILRPWSKAEQCVQNLRELVTRILSKTKELDARSIAFPLIGTGNLGYPSNIVVQVLYMEVTNYLESNVGSCLQKVVFPLPETEKELIKTLRALLIGETAGREEDKDKDKDKDKKLKKAGLEDEELEKYGTLMTEYTNTRIGSVATKRPDLWKMIVGSKQPYSRCELNTSDAEYNDIVRLMSNRNGKDFTKLIYKIERIENFLLWSVYSAMKEALITTNAKGMQNERTLWHGTQLQSVESIIASGFNRSFSEKALYGKGVYFAHNFSYSAQDVYSTPDFMGCKYIFQCRVLTGYICQGHVGLLQPEENTKTRRPYDSAVDNLESPTIFVTFRDYTMYPEYLITLLRT